MTRPTELKDFFKTQKICIIIPTFNNQNTIVEVIKDVEKYCSDILVVNDGSTDQTTELISLLKNIELVSYNKNVGKGYAIRQGFKRALELGFDYAITIDADGQHFADDLEVFAEKHKEYPDVLLIGSRNISADGMPSKNTFANKFSNFWFWVETGYKLPDTQSGFRLYTIKFYKKSKFFTKKYEFEIEVLVRSAWSGIKVIPVPIKVDYPEDRVSHFRPLSDFTRISLLNTCLVLITYLWIVPRNAFRYLTRNKFVDVIRDQITAHNDKPSKIALALGFGVFMGIAPIWGFQMLVAAFLAHFFRLNKILVLAASNISLPPLIPFIIYFSYHTGGLILKSEQEITGETLIYLRQQIADGEFYATFQEFGYSIFQYVVGALIFGLTMGIAVGLVSYLILRLSGFSKKMK
jgi:glycosyltransferase involved in cell wall biosynthesis